MSATGFRADCLTTAMGILPHTDIERGLEAALSLDIPFWPQLRKRKTYPAAKFFKDRRIFNHFKNFFNIIFHG